MKRWLTCLGLACAFAFISSDVFAEDEAMDNPLRKADFVHLDEMPEVVTGLPADAAARLQADLKNTNPNLRITTEPLSKRLDLVPFEIKDAFQLMLVAMRDQIKLIEAQKIQIGASSASDKEKKEMIANADHQIDKLELAASEMLMVYEHFRRFSPVVFAVSYHFGVEIPLKFTKHMLREAGYLSFQGSLGLSIYATANKASGSFSALGAGITTLSGCGVTFGSSDNVTRRMGASGVKTLQSVSLLIPWGQKVPATSLGDLQGWYWGGSIDISNDRGNISGTPSSFQIGGYFMFGLDSFVPRATMLVATLASGASDSGFMGQVEGLHYGTLVAGDTTAAGGGDGNLSLIRSPIPFVGNFSSSAHSEQKRYELAKQKYMPNEATVRSHMAATRDKLRRVNAYMERLEKMREKQKEERLKKAGE